MSGLPKAGEVDGAIASEQDRLASWEKYNAVRTAAAGLLLDALRGLLTGAITGNPLGGVAGAAIPSAFELVEKSIDYAKAKST